MSNAPDPEQPPLVRLDDVSVTYDGVERPVLDGVSLTLAANATMAVIGPSGCGKSTLLNITGALLRPTRGSVTFDGQSLDNRSDDELSTFRNEHLGFVFQSHHLLPQCSAMENVLIPSIVHPDDSMRSTAPDRARALLTEVGLADRLTHRPGQLSGGECQRVAVARALINEPRLLLADEPTGSLDEENAAQLTDLLLKLNHERGLAMIMVTHATALAHRMERVLALRHGRLEPDPTDA